MFFTSDAPLRTNKIRQQIDSWIPEEHGAADLESMIYNHLNVIDTKTQSTMQASSVMLLASSILEYADPELQQVERLSEWVGFDPLAWLVPIAAICFFVSIFACVSVVYLHWIPAGYERDAGRDDFEIRLVQIRNHRTRRYRAAWLFSILGLSLIAASISYAAIGALIPSQVIS